MYISLIISVGKQSLSVKGKVQEMSDSY